MSNLKAHFSKSIGQDGAPLHFAAHSHHPWPNVTYDAHNQAWLDAAKWLDLKWDERVEAEEIRAKSFVANILNLPSPETIVFGQNTHEFVLRLLSCCPTDRPVRILTTTSEFHSFSRQIARLEEEGLVIVTRIDCEPFVTFEERFVSHAKEDFDLIYFSQVFFDSGFGLKNLSPIVDAFRASDSLIVVDGYHSFMARPVDFSEFADRCFFIAGGYKYAMAGEGVCFMHCPPGIGDRPRNTGWYAAFGDLRDLPLDAVPYATSAQRFKGATYDPVGLYRFNAVQTWLTDLNESVDEMYRYSKTLQQLFLKELEQTKTPELSTGTLLDLPESHLLARFLTFDTPDASVLQDTLQKQNVITDCRGTRLRIGFSIYQAEDDVGRLVALLNQ